MLKRSHKESNHVHLVNIDYASDSGNDSVFDDMDDSSFNKSE